MRFGGGGLRELRSDWRLAGRAARFVWPRKDKQIVYALLADQEDMSAGLSIGLYSRLGPGKTELKRLRLQTDQIAALPDPLDRQLIAMLFGLASGQMIVSSTTGRYRQNSRCATCAMRRWF